MKNNLSFGKISGYVSVFFSTLAFFALLCFKFPQWLTTPQFREIYTGESMKLLLTLVIIASFFFGVLSFLFSEKKKTALLAMVIGVLTVLLGGFEVTPSDVANKSIHLGLDWLLLDLFVMAIIFIPIEMVFPKRPNQTQFHSEWRTDLTYFVVSHLLVQFFGVITQQPAKLFFGWMGLEGFQDFIQSLPFLVELFIAFFVADLFQYWTHRFFHSHIYLWRFHSIHHSTENMDWLAGSRTHFVDIFVTRSMAFIPLYIFGFSTLTFNTYVIFMAIHVVLIHSNTRIEFGFLKYIFATPQYHHWHHCIESEHYGNNFATIFPFIDRIFGTYYLPEKVWPSGTGVTEADFPKGYLKQAMYPFQQSPFDQSKPVDDPSHR